MKIAGVVVVLAHLVSVDAFLLPSSARPSSSSSSSSIASRRRMMLMKAQGNDPNNRNKSKWGNALGRSLAASTVMLSTFLGGLIPPPSHAAQAASNVDQQTMQKQRDRLDKEKTAELKEEAKDLSNLIAKGIVRLPEIEGYPLGPERPATLNYALENDNAALLIACYGREGGPVAAKKIPLRGLEFPYAFELSADNLLFPLTKETWGKDTRAFDDLGISVLLDLDGRFATANENDLIGFGISKPVLIAGSQIRRDALVVVQARTGVKQYTEDEQRVLAKIDLGLEQQARGASLAQLAAESGSTIEVLTAPGRTVEDPLADAIE